MPQPTNLDKIKFATDASTFKKAVDLYEKRKSEAVRRGTNGFFADCFGTKPYKVYVD